MIISGIPCNVSIHTVNGMLQAIINNNMSQKPFKFEIKSLFKQQKQINIKKELERVYFTVEYNHNGKEKIVF